MGDPFGHGSACTCHDDGAVSSGAWNLAIVDFATDEPDDCLTWLLKLAEFEAAMRRCLTRPERGR